MKIAVYDQKHVLSDWQPAYPVEPVALTASLSEFGLLVMLGGEAALVEVKARHPNLPVLYLSEVFPTLQIFDEWLPQPVNFAWLEHKVALYLTPQHSLPPQTHMAQIWRIESQFVALLSVCRLGILGCDAEGFVVWHNRASEPLLGRQDILGCALGEVLSVDGREKNPRFNQVSIQLQTPIYAIFQLYFFEEMSGLEIIKKEIEGFKGYLKLRAEEHMENLSSDKARLEKANKAKSDVLAQLSHELRTPMHAILSMANFGTKKIGRIEQKRLVRYFDTIQRSGHQLLGLLSNLLDLSELNTGKMQYHFSVVPLHRILLNVEQDMQALLLERQMHLQITPPIFDDAIRVDPDKMRQVLGNLVSNAIKFSPKHSTIAVDIVAHDQALVLRVMDEGIGIPDNELDHVFKKFAQSSMTKLDNMGTGLGLAICCEMVEAHGGSIKAENRVPHGACFSITLPL